VLGYAAAVFYRRTDTKEKAGNRKKAGISLGLLDEEKKTLRADRPERHRRKTERGPEQPREKPTSNLKEKRGAFVLPA